MFCSKNHLKVKFGDNQKCPACKILKERAMFEMLEAQEREAELPECDSDCEAEFGAYCDICKVNGGKFDPRRD